MSRLARSSLRSRLFLLVALAVLPAVALILFTAWEQRRLAAEGIKEDALRVARLASTTHERLIDSARSLLIGLAQLSDVQMHNSRACSAHFAEIQRQFPLYRNVGAIRPDGAVFCAARGLPRPGSVAGNPSFQRARTAREFTASGYLGHRTPGEPVLTLWYPAVDRAGAVWAVVFAELDLGWVNQLAEKARLPEGTVISVTDVRGLVLHRYPDPGRWVGRSVPESPLVQAIRRQPGGGVTEAPGLDGVPRLSAFAPLSGPNGSEPVYVSVGIPRDVWLAEADRLLLRNLFWTGFVIVLALGAAAIASDLFILRRVTAVVSAAERLTAGDLTARAAVGGGDEIGVMARTFNVMAERLADRVREAQGAKEALAERVSELDLLNRMGELLQACLTLDEAYRVIGSRAGELFPSESGAVFSLSPSRNIIEAMATWGGYPPERTVFSPEKCWALRNGQSHIVPDTRSAVLCEHLPETVPSAYLCIPLVAQGEALGVLYVGRPAASDGNPPGFTEAKRRLVEAVAAQLALGLANVKLREVLRSQSIRDSLTGLFNRRYLEETLEREVRRARRARRPLGVLMLDVDGFKLHNDTFGHDTGDQVLRELGLLIQANLRREDVACRYGGEEFLLVLPDAGLEDARRRGEQLREAVKRLRVSSRGQTVGPITVSIGVAALPDHGLDRDSLVMAADAALYRAKRDGRDRVAVATGAGDAAPPAAGQHP